MEFIVSEDATSSLIDVAGISEMENGGGSSPL